MTDDEIMKALECCAMNKCDKCSIKYECRGNKIRATVIIAAFDLINRQRERIEELEKGELSKAMTFNSDTIKRCSAEAIREFAEKFKSTLENLEAKSPNKTYQTAMQDMLAYYVPTIIDNLVKEMTEK